MRLLLVPPLSDAAAATLAIDPHTPSLVTPTGVFASAPLGSTGSPQAPPLPPPRRKKPRPPPGPLVEYYPPPPDDGDAPPYFCMDEDIDAVAVGGDGDANAVALASAFAVVPFVPAPPPRPSDAVGPYVLRTPRPPPPSRRPALAMEALEVRERARLEAREAAARTAQRDRWAAAADTLARADAAARQTAAHQAGLAPPPPSMLARLATPTVFLVAGPIATLGHREAVARDTLAAAEAAAWRADVVKPMRLSWFLKRGCHVLRRFFFGVALRRRAVAERRRLARARVERIEASARGDVVATEVARRTAAVAAHLAFAEAAARRRLRLRRAVDEVAMGYAAIALAERAARGSEGVLRESSLPAR